jgi:hypothetical protein
MTIKRLWDGNRIVEFNEVLQFDHYGGPEFQGEVGLLDRNIVIQGDENSNLDNFGGHIIIRGAARLAGVEFSRMGQRNRMGRYPVVGFHFFFIATEFSF